MAEYFDHRHSSYGHSYRGTEPSMEENALNHSMTRGSHQSQASGVSPSTKSWVASNQARPPPPPPEESAISSVVQNNVRPPRPLPAEPQFRQSRVPVKYEMAVEPEEHQHGGFTHMGIDPRDFPFGYPSQDIGRGPPGSSMSPLAPQMATPSTPAPNRSFVGGFFKGLKRLPKMLRGGSKSDTRKLKRQGTFGTEGTSTTALGIERGNTLPRYLSNPSIGPSNPQFAHRLSMAGPSNTMPHSGAIPAEYHPRSSPIYPQDRNAYPPEDSVFIRNNPAGPQRPVVTLTPPSDGMPVEEGQADFYDGPTAEYPQRQLDDIMESESSRHGRATVMMYNTDSQAPTMNPTLSRSSPPPGPRRSNTPGPGRVSYQQELPTRATLQAQSEPMPLPSILVPMATMRGSGSTQPTMQSPDTYRSPRDTSRYTMTTLASHYDPSFTSDLSPIEKFFKGLYNLPWVAERITVDYRPANSDRARKKIKAGIKKPLASWYRSVMTRSRHISQDLDLLSAGTGSMSGMSISRQASPVSPQHSHRKHHSGQTKSSRRTRRNKDTSASTDAHQPRGPSPIIPGPYPYAYPAVYQYPYPYGGYIPAPQTAPRGPRSHRRRKTPKYQTAVAGYPVYQPMAMPVAPPQPMPAPGAPVYFITPSPPQSNNGGNGDPAGQQAAAQQFAQQYGSRPVQISPVIMQYVPGAYNPNAPNMISPPLTPQRHGKNAAT